MALPWIVVNSSKFPTAEVCRFESISKAEHHAAELNRLTRTKDYTVLFHLSGRS